MFSVVDAVRQSFSPASVAEIAIIDRSLGRARGKFYLKMRTARKCIQTAYANQGNFMTAFILNGNKLYPGTAKRNPIDEENIIIAMNIALTRAARAEPVTLPSIMRKGIKVNRKNLMRQKKHYAKEAL